VLALAASVALGACGQVDAGEVGLFSRYGAVSDQTAGPGLHWYNPITTNLEVMSVQSQRWNGNTAVYTRDLQTANVSFSLIYRLSSGNAVRMRRTVGHDWSERLIPPVVQNTIKNAFGQFDAMRAVAERPRIQQAIYDVVQRRLGQRGIVVEQFELRNIDYSDEFEGAVEQAQVATQRAVAARNATVRVREEATQRVIQAESEARAIQVQAAAIATNPAIVRMRAIERWNGQMCPEGSNTCIIGGGANGPIPFINVGE
jgi:regulator of protease activity HflC (stomatin/prohibitin superfamily)